MQIENNLSSISNFVLCEALLIYKDEKGSAYASVHKVEQSGEKFFIGAGQSLGLRSIEQALESIGKGEKVGFIDESLIYHSRSCMVWWIKPEIQTQHFKVSNEGEMSIKSWQPSLVLAVKNGTMYIFALNSDKRPDGTSELFNAPYYNVFKDGRVCTGNVKMPAGLATKELINWKQAFFNSYFTHGNHKDLVKSTLDFKEFWKQREWAGNKFPSKALIKAGFNLKKFIEG